MKQIKRAKIRGFTVAEHLKVQEQIEQRAYELWLARGSRQNGALENWVRAEREVLQDFVQARTDALDFRGNC